MKKFTVVISIVVAISLALVGCGNSSQKNDEIVDKPSTTISENQTTTEQGILKGYSIEQLVQMTIDTLKTRDTSSVKKYEIPKADEALKYLYDKYDDMSSAIVDCEFANIESIFNRTQEKNIYLDKSFSYYEENLTTYSKSTGEEKEELELFFNEAKESISYVNPSIKITDVGSFEIRCENDQNSIDITVLTVKTESGWFALGFDY